jgi:Na+/H+ antiporter NhaD/arsenite permease-like protein
VAGTIIFIAIWPLVVFDFSKFFPISRPAAALVGGTLMVIFYVLEQSEVFKIIGGVEGSRGELRTLFLLMGMMLLSFYFDREGLLRLVAEKVFGTKGASFPSILWKVCVVSGVVSALITNDAACVIITPLLVKEHFRQKRDKKELYFLCLAIATSANIGSAATFFGNPQNAFIASSADVNLLQFLISLLPASVFGLLLNTALLYLYYVIQLYCSSRCWGTQRESGRQPRTTNLTSSLPGSVHDSGQGEDGSIEDLTGAEQPLSLPTEREARRQLQNPSLGVNRNSLISFERDTLLGSMSMLDTWARRTGSLRRRTEGHAATSGIERELTESKHAKSLPILPLSSSQSMTYGTLEMSSEGNRINSQEVPPSPTHADGEDGVVVTERTTDSETKQKKWQKYLFVISLFIVTGVVMGLLVIPKIPINDHYYLQFDLGLVPFGGAVIIMLIDAIVNRRSAYDAMVQIDWTLILLFMGLFVWLEGFKATKFPEDAFKALKSHMTICNVPGVLLFTVFILVASNLVSNVPLTILIVDSIKDLSEACVEDTSSPVLVPAMLLAWVATVAGNFSLIGSIANLLVAEKAKTSEHKYILGFFAYLKFGAVSTLLVTFSGVPIVYALSRFAAARINV